MAAVALVRLSAPLQFKFGVWDALATGGSWGFSRRDTVLVTGELEYAYALRDGALPGGIAVGAGYLSEGEMLEKPFGAAYGYSLQWEQKIFREGDGNAEDTQGLANFAALYPRFPGAPVPGDTIGDSLVAGLAYTGLLPQRDADVVGAGAVWAELYQGGTNLTPLVSRTDLNKNASEVSFARVSRPGGASLPRRALARFTSHGENQNVTIPSMPKMNPSSKSVAILLVRPSPQL